MHFECLEFCVVCFACLDFYGRVGHLLGKKYFTIEGPKINFLIDNKRESDLLI